MWPSSRNFGWNVRDVGPKRDIIGELEKTFRKKEKIHFIYITLSVLSTKYSTLHGFYVILQKVYFAAVK
jgi:Alpha-L-fucosidase